MATDRSGFASFVPESRRSFLTKTAALAGAATALGSVGPAYAGRPIPRAARRTPVGDGEPIRIAIVGPGGMGTGHADRLAFFNKEGMESLKIAALCDVCDVRAQDAAKMLDERYGMKVETICRDHKEIMARDDIHAVLVATTEHWHGPLAEDAIKSGKDVYCEKPMTLRLDEALRLHDVVKANPEIIFQVGTQHIMYPKYVAAQKVIAEGTLGKALWSQTSYCRNTPTGEWNYYSLDNRWKPGENLDWERWCGHLGAVPWDPKIYARWRRYRAYSTGIIGDLLVHEATPLLMSLGAGWPTRVVATGGHYIDKDMENHDQVNLNVEFEGGHTMIIAGSTNNETGLPSMIRCQKANIFLNGPHCTVRPESKFASEIDPFEIKSEDIGDPQNALRLDWLNSIRTRKPNRSQVDLATKMMVIVDLATRSLWDGAAYEYDPQTRRVKRL